jgi:hypothetical protein
MILHNWKIKAYLKDKICYRNIWEATKDGFENRSNYRYDEEAKEIKFDRNIIFVNKERCFTNDTVLANTHLHNNISWFSLLIDINKSIDQAIKPFEKLIKEQLEDITKDYCSEQYIKKSTYYSDLFVKKFISDYGKLGRQLLIKWLNRLNDSSISDEELADEYLNDMNNARIIFESCNNQKYPNGMEQGVQFDYILLRVIEKYCPRGRHFGSTYRSIYPRERCKQYKKNTNSI